MKAYGEYMGVYFVRQGWCIYNLAHEYHLQYGEQTKAVYVNTLRDLKDKIREAIEQWQK